MNKFYITCAIPYVNAKPHIGHALEYVQTDVIARGHKRQGEEVVMLSGGDENALKNVQAAENAGLSVQEFVDKNTQAFFDLTKKLGCVFDIWQKGSDKGRHFVSSQKLWQLCVDKGDIYKKAYKGLYCVGCEAFYTPEELNENGECVEHPGKKLEEITEENYFFRLSKYQKQLEELIEKNQLIITPEFRKNETLSFIKSGLQDISISRSVERAKHWGVPVPGDDSQIMYVWFDALNIYQTGIGFGWNEEKYNKLWPADLHVIGKGIIRFHAVYWPAFLLSAGLKLPKEIMVHGYFTVNGQKMSKTVGNVIDPIEIINKYGTEPLRYYLLAQIPPFGDGDFSEEKLREVYNADLANGLGNLVARVAKLCERERIIAPEQQLKMDSAIVKLLQEYKFNECLQLIWEKIKKEDGYFNEKQPWKQSGEELKETLLHSVNTLQQISIDLLPFLPETAEKLQKQFSGNIKSQASFFPRL